MAPDPVDTHQVVISSDKGCSLAAAFDASETFRMLHKSGGYVATNREGETIPPERRITVRLHADSDDDAKDQVEQLAGPIVGDSFAIDSVEPLPDD